jgi:hypothetical protein
VTEWTSGSPMMLIDNGYVPGATVDGTEKVAVID